MSSDYTDAKEEFEFWIETYSDQLKEWPEEFKFKYKRGREPDVLAYIILSDDERKLIQN